MKNILVATYPFGLCGIEPVEMLKKTGWNIYYNSLGDRLKNNEVREMLCGMDAVIAGTEPYNRETIEGCKNLKVISRVGIGLDNVDFEACKENGVVVTYTPDAPSNGVAGLTIAQILNLLRGVHISNNLVKRGEWKRVTGKLVREIKIGVLGVGRIGAKVIRRLIPFGADIYACDSDSNVRKKWEMTYQNIKWVDKTELFKECDLVTIHIPLNDTNRNCVGLKELSSMKSGSFVINTSRGPILDEDALVSLLYNKHLAGAALDVFIKEPYEGPLINFENVLLTAHIASSARESRYLMECRAVEDCVRFLRGQPVLRLALQDIK
jgi:D-3-phosphoglycerate dehydrogenase / 2-oxoglutarate reductase